MLFHNEAKLKLQLSGETDWIQLALRMFLLLFEVKVCNVRRCMFHYFPKMQDVRQWAANSS